MWKLLVLVVAISCAHKPAFVFGPNHLTWADRNVDDLLTHPYYATMPMEERTTPTGVKVYSFKNSGGRMATATCAPGLFGGAQCDSASLEVACNHVFTVSQNKVKNYQRIGDCGPELLKFRPLQDGEPVLTEDEIQRMGSRDVASEPITKDCGIAGKLFGC